MRAGLRLAVAAAAVLAVGGFRRAGPRQRPRPRVALRATEEPCPSLSITGTIPEAQPEAQQYDPASLDGSLLLPIDTFLNSFSDAEFSGVYAVSDKFERVVFVGISKHVTLALRHHLETLGADDVNAVQVRHVDSPKRSAMERLRMQWVDFLPYTPEGNQPGEAGARWAASVQAATEAVVAVEVPVYTESAKPKPNPNPNPSAASAPVVSPFESGAEEAPSSVGESLEFTRENMEKVLDEVRPFLQADGGDVTLKDLDPAGGGVVSLELVGACGSCPSATVTMQMGIERRLREDWPNIEVKNVTEAPPPGAPAKPELEELSVLEIGKALQPILPTIESMGGSVQIVDVDKAAGSVTLSYNGPPRIANGIELSLKDLPQVKEVIFQS
eukprot:CAMPEP_0118878642 /NCGR_PEP_ID=MMETSP1163-20130328/18559_1 /TAXON_ID=124430 /ORGANISM="Phaeomonas parva, Strain CCMP2877" /LENGTH=385 /DNA_ID=CAMNT_0006814553 /DNA_START=124 /DNA_END=1281 /DNA_ORIENTATION=+